MNTLKITKRPAYLAPIVLSLMFLLSLSPVTGYSGEKVEAITVFIDKHHTTSKGGLVDKTNESHKEMGAKGWQFKSLALYDEDGDLRGLFVTYTRAAE